MATSDLTKITGRVLWLLGSHNGSFNDTVADDRFIAEEIKRAIVETEAEIVRDLCESYHPMRLPFLALSADLENGDGVPEHIGQIEAVWILPTSTSNDPILAESTSRSNILAWRENHNNVFDAADHDQAGSSLTGYFNITNDTITFTGYRAQVNICTYIPNYSALQIDNAFDGMLVAGTIPKLNKIGVEQSLVATQANIYAQMRSTLREKNMPEIGQAQIIQ